MTGNSRIYLYLGSLLFLLPFIRIQIFLDPFTMGRFVLWSLSSLLALFFIYPSFKKIHFHYLDIPFALFYLVNLVSVMWSKNFGESIYMTQHYLLGLFTYFTIKQILLNHPEQKQVILKMIYLFSIIGCGWLLYEFYKIWNQSGLEGDSIYLISGLSGHKNLSASHLFLLLGFLLFFQIGDKRSRGVIGLGFVMVLLIILLRSRAVYLALIALITCTALVFFTKTYLLKKKVLVGLIGSIILLGTISTLFFTKTPIGSQYLEYFNPKKYAKSASGTERLFVWYKTFNLIKERPLAGYGCGNWKLWFPSKDIQGGFRLQEQGIVFTRTHNDFLEVWAEVGILGLMFYLSIFGIAAYTVFHRFKQMNQKMKLQSVILLGVLLGYVIIAFLGFPKERPEHQILLSTLFALMVSQRPDVMQITALPFSQFRLIQISLFLWLLISFPIGLYRTKAEVGSRQLLLATTTQNTSAMSQLAISSNSIWQNVNIMVIPFKWYEGLAYYWEGHYENAEIAFHEAYQINPFNFNVINNYGSTLAQLGKYPDSIAIFERVLAINPTFEPAIFNLAFAHYQLGDTPAALKWLQQISKNQERKKLFMETIQNGKDIDLLE